MSQPDFEPDSQPNSPTSTPAVHESTRRFSVADFARRYWLPLLAFVILAAVCTDTNYYDGRPLATKFSGEYYKLYIAVSVVTLLFLAWRRRALGGVRQIVELILLTLILTNVSKFVLPLGRPPRMKAGVIDPHSTYSPGFPSAHTMLAFGLAWMVFEFKPPFAPFWFAFAIAVGWSRIELFSHYPYQVLCGAVFGSLLAYWISHTPRGVLAAVRDFFIAQRRAATSKNSPAA